MVDVLGPLLWFAYGAMMALLALNLVHLWRGRRRIGEGAAPFVSVLIPARNEEANLPRLLSSLMAQGGVRFEVVVYDDASTDQTAAIAERFGDPRIRVLRGSGPPAGWVGKVHALFRATRVARGEVYLFLDADTALKDDRALERVVGRWAALPSESVLTALPHFRGAARVLVSAIPHALFLTLPLPLVPRLRSKVFAALNGQMWMIARDAYHALEPHERHPAEVLEDVRIGQYLSVNGVAPYFADLQDDLEVWMYRGLAEAWRGFRKNAYPVMGGRPLPFLLIYGWFALTFVVAPVLSPWFLIPIYGTKLASDRFTRQPLWVSLLAPLTFALWAVLELDSFISHLRGRVRWKDRDVRRLPDYAGDGPGQAVGCPQSQR